MRVLSSLSWQGSRSIQDSLGDSCAPPWPHVHSAIYTPTFKIRLAVSSRRTHVCSARQHSSVVHQMNKAAATTKQMLEACGRVGGSLEHKWGAPKSPSVWAPTNGFGFTTPSVRKNIPVRDREDLERTTTDDDNLTKRHAGQCSPRAVPPFCFPTAADQVPSFPVAKCRFAAPRDRLIPAPHG